MRRKIISEFLRDHPIQIEVPEIKLWASVDIDFVNDNRQPEETSFDVTNILAKSGAMQLDECFSALCKESGIKTPKVLSITITNSAQSKELLELGE